MKVKLYIEDRKMTNLMRASDLFPARKVLARSREVELDRGYKESDEDFARKIFSVGINDQTHRLVAVDMGTLFACLPDVIEISDGYRSMFVRE